MRSNATAAPSRPPPAPLGWVLALLAVMGVVALFAGAPVDAANPAGAVPTSTSAKSFFFRSWVTKATVNPDASMDVTEALTYVFVGGPFNFGIRSFSRDNDKITDFHASDPDGPLAVILPADSVSGDWEWKLRQPTSNTTVTYTVSYHVDDATQVGDDVGQLYWQFIGTEHERIDSVDITVTMPGGAPPAVNATNGVEGTADADTSVTRGFAYGPSNGVLEVTAGEIHAAVTSVPANRFIEIRAIAPASAFTAPSNGKNILAKALRDQRGEDVKDKRRTGWILAPILGAVGLLGTGALWFAGGRERKSREVLGEYWREPLDVPPAIAALLLHRGRASQGTLMAATIVDMAQRGYLTITGESEHRLGPDKTVHTYRWAGKQYAEDVQPWERGVLEFVFRGTTQTTSDELTSWARHHQGEAKLRLSAFSNGVKQDYDARGYEAPRRAKYVVPLVLLAAVVGIGGLVINAALHNGVGIVLVVLAVVLLASGLRVLGNRTQQGVEEAARAKGLRNFLRDFSQLKDAPVGHLILWERYLVYSVALGVSAELVKGLSTRVPEVANDPSFMLWYVGPMGRFDGFDRIAVSTAATVSASTPNSSGGGGGFSGGGGGGGGGGGAGAR